MPEWVASYVSNSNTGAIEEYIADLAACVDEVRGQRTDGRATNYATLE